MSATASPVQLACIALVLEELSAEVEALGAALCSDPALAQSLLYELQAIDLIAQKQRSLAGVLVADCADSAIGDLPIEALRQRLSRLPETPLRQNTGVQG